MFTYTCHAYICYTFICYTYICYTYFYVIPTFVIPSFVIPTFVIPTFVIPTSMLYLHLLYLPLLYLVHATGHFSLESVASTATPINIDITTYQSKIAFKVPIDRQTVWRYLSLAQTSVLWWKIETDFRLTGAPAAGATAACENLVIIVALLSVVVVVVVPGPIDSLCSWTRTLYESCHLTRSFD